MAGGALDLVASAESGEAPWLGKADKDLVGQQLHRTYIATGGDQRANAKTCTCWHLEVLSLFCVPSCPQVV